MSPSPLEEPSTSATPDVAAAVRMLADLGERLTRATQAADAITCTGRAVVDLVRPDRVLLALRDVESGQCTTAFAHNYVTSATHDPIVDFVIRQGPRVLASVSDVERRRLGLDGAEAVGSLVAVPILSPEGAIGAIVATAPGAGQLTAWHAEVLTAVAAQLGLALGNVRLRAHVSENQIDRRRLQDQLIQSEKMSAIGQLIAGVAHDLNNPLASVIGFADYLVEEGRDAPPSMRKPLEAIRQEAERAAGIVRNLLSFARKHEGERHAMPIEPVLGSTLLLLKNQLMASKVEARLELARDLPSVKIDPTQMQQVFVNLINNAAQAMLASGVGDTITVRAEPCATGVAVTVADNGPGVPAAVAGRIFEPFFTTKVEGEGTGLGLSICQGILTEHDGRITYADTPGGGASFRVELPGGTTRAPRASLAPRDPGRLRILVVDDEPHILHYMSATLEAWGHEVTATDDCVTALARAAHDDFDVIISDLRMPGVGGREFYEHLRVDRPQAAARMVFATGDTVRGDVLEFLESAGRPWLRKPFTLAELREVLASVGR